MKISIFGTGYVGLVTGTCLAEVGHDIMCIDIDENKIENLKKGIIPIYEPGLEELVLKNYKEGRLKFSTNPKEGVNFGEAIFSAVGTPPDKDNNHKADLKFVKIVAKTFGENIEEYKVFINKSTVPVGTGDICTDIIKEETDINFDVVSNPEFLREGTAIKDFMVPDRIVCGVENEKSKEIMDKIYAPFKRDYVNIIYTDIKSAELIKYAANSFLATKLSFINEIANFAEKVGANISDISRGIGSDKRIGDKFLHAGIGYGGSCFPKDVQALIQTGLEYDYDFKIIKATEEVNKLQKIKVVEKLQKHIQDLKGKTISIWGVSFKPKTDDTRDAPSIDVINRLLELGVSKVNLYDPVALDNIKYLFEDNNKVNYCNSNYETLEKSNGLIILTEWDEFRTVDYDKMTQLMTNKIVIDGRNIWEKEELEKNGFTYECIGK